MNPKSVKNQNEPKVLIFSELSKKEAFGPPKKRAPISEESRIVGIEDQAKRELANKIIEKGKSF